MTRSITIIGAGMAGLAAARRLGAAGYSITLFDKSRGVGGRMATRRLESLQLDHGAQYFTARGDAFRVLVAEWQGAGQTGEWFDGAFVGTPGMTAPARTMVGHSTLMTGVQVTGLERQPGGWSVRTSDGPVDMAANGSFSAVILAVPSPQAVPLLASAGVRLHGVDKATYAPCWALMLAFAEPVLDAPYRRFTDGPISWIARNSSKPGRSPAPETLVVHASPDWSRTHLEMAPADAAAALLAHLRALTGIPAEPTYSAAHRWRYALVEQAAGVPCLWDSEAQIGACGDWCLGPRVEAAFDSGEAMAAAVLASD